MRENEICPECGLEMVYISKNSYSQAQPISNNLNDYNLCCPKCDNDLIPEKVRGMDQRQVSMAELKIELAERFELITNFIKSAIDWIGNRLDLIYQVIIILLFLVCLFQYHLNRTSVNIVDSLLEDNLELTDKYHSSLEDYYEVVLVLDQAIFRLWLSEEEEEIKICFYDYLNTSKIETLIKVQHTWNQELIDSVLYKP